MPLEDEPETVYGCDVPGHPNYYAHQHDPEIEEVQQAPSFARKLLRVGRWILIVAGLAALIWVIVFLVSLTAVMNRMG